MSSEVEQSAERSERDPKRVAEKEQWRDDLRVLLRCLQDSRSPWYATALILGVLVWGAIPVDPVPDAIPLVGIVDDAAVFLIVRSAVYNVIPDDVVEFHTEVVQEKSRFRFGPTKAVGSLAIIQVFVILILLGGFTTFIL